MTEPRAPYVTAAIINPEDLQAAMLKLADMRRQAILRELGELEVFLGVEPTTRKLRRDHESAAFKARLLECQAVKVRGG